MWQLRTSIGLLALIAGTMASSAPAPAPASEATPVEPATGKASTGQRDAELEAAFEDDEVLWLGEGEGKSLAIYRSSLLEKTRGVVVIVHGPGLPADAHTVAAGLRRALPRSGWATLTIELPASREQLPLAAAASQQTPPGQETPAAGVASAPIAVDRLLGETQARLNAAVVEARVRSKRVILLGQDAAGVWLMWAQSKGLGADALIVINAPREVPRIEGLRPKSSLAEVATPTLLLMATPHEWSRDDRLSPSVELRRLPLAHPDAEILERRVRGWLKRRYPNA